MSLVLRGIVTDLKKSQKERIRVIEREREYVVSLCAIELLVKHHSHFLIDSLLLKFLTFKRQPL